MFSNWAYSIYFNYEEFKTVSNNFLLVKFLSEFINALSSE